MVQVCWVCLVFPIHDTVFSGSFVSLSTHTVRTDRDRIFDVHGYRIYFSIVNAFRKEGYYLFRQYYGYQESGGGGGPPPGSGAAGGGPGVVDYQPPPPPPGEYPLPPYYGGYPPPPHPPPPPPPNPAYLHSQGRPFVDRKYRHLLKKTVRGKFRNSTSFLFYFFLSHTYV